MYKLDKSAIHHFFAQVIISQKRNLVGIKLRHRLCRKLATNSIMDGIHKNFYKLIHALLSSLRKEGVFYLNFHIVCTPVLCSPNFIANGRLPVAKAIRCKVNANERNNKTKYAVFDFVIPECSLTY